MNIVIIQAHMQSTRLPGKVMKLLDDNSVLYHVYNRSRMAKLVDKVIIATSISEENDVIEEMCKRYGITCFRGSENDVLDRYYECAKVYEPEVIVRVTSDCPLLEPKLIDEWVRCLKENNLDFIEEENGLYTGFGVDVFSYKALEKMNKLATTSKQKEHVVGFYLENKQLFNYKECPLPRELSYLYRAYRLTLDTEQDYKLICFLYKKFLKEGFINLEDVIKFIDNNQKVLAVNKEVHQKMY